MRKLQFPRHPIAPIVVPGRTQLDISPSAGTTISSISEPGAAVPADLGPLPVEIEFQNLFWNKSLVSLEGMGQPTPETVWIRPYPPDYTRPQKNLQSRPHSLNLGFTGPQIGNGSSIEHHESRLDAVRCTNHHHPSSRITILPSPASPITETSPRRILPAQVEFQDAFWGQIQVPTANINEELLGRKSSNPSYRTTSLLSGQN